MLHYYEAGGVKFIAVSSHAKLVLLAPITRGPQHLGLVSKTTKMAGVTISELVEAVGISEAILRERCTDEHLNIVARFLDWRTTAPCLGLSENEIEDIEDEDRRNDVRRRKTLQLWKRKHCFKATYRRLVEVFLCLGRADHAEELCRLLLPPGGYGVRCIV